MDLLNLSEDRFDQDVGLSFPVQGINGFVGEVVEVRFPLLPAHA